MYDRTMKRRNVQRNVQWVAGESPAAAGKKAPPPRYSSTDEPDEALTPHLVPGALFYAKWDMYQASDANVDIPFPILVAAQYDTSGYTLAQRQHWYPVHKGNIVLYAGTVRYAAEGTAGVLRITRHTIIAHGRRYIIERLNSIEPGG